MQEKSGKTYTILVIEDDPDMLQLLRRILESKGFHVILAADGTYGMTLLKETRPDLVLLDIIMPGPDGFTVLDSIRKFSNVPVIIVTAKRDAESLKKTLALGADDYIKKPFSSAELVARIHAKLRRV